MSPTPTPRELETFHTVGEAAVRLRLKTQAEHDAGSIKGERFLRDGVNRPDDGSKGERFPCHRMSGQLLFSDSQLAEIADLCVNAPTRRGRTRRARRTQVKPVVRTAEPQAA